MPPFEPIGKVARWKTIYSILSTRPVGDTVTYAELGNALNLDPAVERERRKIQMAMIRASEEFEQRDKHALDVIPNVGYKIVEANEHIRLAGRHQRKANSQLVRGHSKAVNVDLNGIDEQTKHALEVVARGFALQMDFNRRLSDRQDRADKLIDDLYGRVRDLERRADG